MKAIKFSNDYYKLPEHWQGTNAVLIAVSYCKDVQGLKKELSNFLHYDAVIRDDDVWNAKYYPLDFKEGIILVFVPVETGTPFTTIRRYTPEKMKYYEGCIWQTFQMVEST